MNLYTDFIRYVKKSIRTKLEQEDFADDSANPLAWEDLERQISEELNSLYLKIHKIPFIIKYPKPPPGFKFIPPLDKRNGIKLQVLSYLKHYFERKSNRTFALLHDSGKYPLHLFDSTQFDELIHKRRYTMDFHDAPIQPDIPYDLWREAEAIAGECGIPKKVWMPHFQNFYKEQMNILQDRRNTGQRYYHK
jgi:hypothetical protein